MSFTVIVTIQIYRKRESECKKKNANKTGGADKWRSDYIHNTNKELSQRKDKEGAQDLEEYA